ncbi:phosphate/phosphite/phosphonate ABC transporter substrate-binding protein [Magnetospira sp. QH-2]|uniref:phosphate/phosphite/phosphonate ABC transporter substrate-binding protein n=1 Tax=Magnetospira sp. (strain QH-2) TaxID=1288970 RepID=UPI000696F871|nr:phosphate/phosphite/phosphonate ABC transporter substrate-binding protein [Magnetospira sp. QH-2]
MRAAEPPLVLAIHPYRPATTLVQVFQPLADILGQSLGRTVQVDISYDYQTHVDRIQRDQVDLAYMGPAAFVGMWANGDPKRLLGRLEIAGAPTFHGMIVTSEGSPVHALSDLHGKRMAFGDPLSTMSHLVPRFMLLQAGVGESDLADMQFLGSHDDVALGVLMGRFDAGAVKQEVFDKYGPRGLRGLQATPEISEHVFVASDRLDQTQVDKLRRTLIGLAGHKEGLTALRSIKSTASGIVSATVEDYRNLRDILADLKKRGIAP